MSGLLHQLFFDPDVNGTHLLKKAYGPLLVIVPYVLFVKCLGPRLMRQRPPFALQAILVLYNLLLVIGNAYLMTVSIYYTWKHSNHMCGLKRNPDFPNIRTEVGIYCWQVYLVKYVELLDTVFFVLRKKDRQISFLHIFHHAAVIILGRYFLYGKNYFGFHILLIGSINCSVHVVMYTYYGLSALGPQMQKYLWWKKYLTTLQLGQFVVLLCYLILAMWTGCESLDPEELLCFVAIALVFILFVNFYKKTFKEK